MGWVHDSTKLGGHPEPLYDIRKPANWADVDSLLLAWQVKRNTWLITHRPGRKPNMHWRQNIKSPPMWVHRTQPRVA
jgi:hypothetical protein